MRSQKFQLPIFSFFLKFSGMVLLYEFKNIALYKVQSDVCCNLIRFLQACLELLPRFTLVSNSWHEMLYFNYARVIKQ